MKKKYEVKLSPFYEMEFKAIWEIDFDFKEFSMQGINTVKKAIIEMNIFWGDSPDKNAPFSEHLDYFLKHATVTIHRIYSRSFLVKPEQLTEYLFSKEGGFDIGECGINLIEFVDEFELPKDVLEVGEYAK